MTIQYNDYEVGEKTWKDYKKQLAASGYTSRRKAEDLIVQGKVEVNGKVVTELGTKVKQGDLITVKESRGWWK